MGSDDEGTWFQIECKGERPGLYGAKITQLDELKHEVPISKRNCLRTRKDIIQHPKIECATLAFAGVDLLLTQERRWTIVEINDHPVALSEGMRLTLEGGCGDIFSRNPFTPLANLLACHGSNPVLLLPDYYRLSKPLGPAKRVRVTNEEAFDDHRIEMTITDFNALAEACLKNEVAAEICDVECLRVHKGQVYNRDRKVNALFRRHSRFPTENVDCMCVNDLRQRLVCGDKYETFKALTNKLGHHASIPSYIFDNSDNTKAFIHDAIDRDCYIILKPRFGSASAGLRRVRASEALIELNINGPNENVICQPWVQPATMKRRDMPYYFDVRIFVVGGRVVSGFARRAAGPCIGLSANSPLSWLTTTGPTIPISYMGGGRKSSYLHQGVEISCDEAARMCDIAETSVRVVDDAGRQVNYEYAVRCISGVGSGNNSVNLTDCIDLTAL